MMERTDNQSNKIYKYQEDDTIDLRKIVFKFINNWYWFFLAILLSVGAGFLYNSYKTPVYQIFSKLLVEEGKTSSPLGASGMNDSGSLFQGLGIMNSMRNINNQMEVLSSTPVISKTLDELDFEISYYIIGNFVPIEKYREVPFSVIWENDHPQVIDVDFYVEIISPDKLIVSADHHGEIKVYNYEKDKVVENIEKIYFSNEIKPGAKINTEYFAFTIIFNGNFNADLTEKYKFRFHSKASLIKKYHKQLEVTLPNKETSILNTNPS